MKKVFRNLLILSISVTGLSGCDLFTTEGDVDVKEEKGIELRDYTQTVVQDASYTFDGKVFLQYEDESEKEVTSDCTFNYTTLDTSKVGNDSYFTVRYEGNKYIFNKKAYITVTKKVTLLDIALSNYSTYCKTNATYTFDGKVTASYDDGSTKDVTDKVTVDQNALNTSVEGNYDVKINYTEGGVSVTKTISVKVATHAGALSNIKATNYTTEVEKGQTYTFDGVVTANYADNTSEIVTDRCTFGTINTSTVGVKTLSISFKDTANNVTKTTTASVEVIARVTGIEVNPSLDVALNKNKSLGATAVPSEAKYKGLNYVSNDTTIATVNANGVVTGVALGTTSVTITSQENSSITETVTVNVLNVVQDKWTILMYVCGADLESDSSQGGAATEDLQEMASVSGQPEDVNIVIQAGGASSWKSTYSSVISASKRNRFHLRNKSFVKDSQDSKVNMGLSSSLQDFITWGINTYPADKIGLVLWNHGGAMSGCCYDEQYSDDPLTPAEVHTAVVNAKTATGYTDKFEFIGYDCCLMQVQDIAGLNADYAKYMVASEESEWGYGWSYDKWLDDVYADKSTTAICKEIVDSFKEETNSAYSSWGYTNDQTLSYLDLSNWDAYETAWENMATTLQSVISSSSAWSTFKSLLNSCQRFGGTSYYGSTVYPFDVFDAGHFFTKIKAHNSYKNNSTLMSNITTLQTAYNNLLAYEFHGNGSPNATGICMFAPVSGYNSSSVYATSNTPFTVWRNLCVTYWNN